MKPIYVSGIKPDKLNTAEKRQQSSEALRLAWSLARNMAHQRGGKPREYMSEAMALAWADVNKFPMTSSEAAEAWAQSEEGKTAFAQSLTVAICAVCFGLILVILGFDADHWLVFGIGATAAIGGAVKAIAAMVFHYDRNRGE